MKIKKWPNQTKVTKHKQEKRKGRGKLPSSPKWWGKRDWYQVKNDSFVKGSQIIAFWAGDRSECITKKLLHIYLYCEGGPHSHSKPGNCLIDKFYTCCKGNQIDYHTWYYTDTERSSTGKCINWIVFFPTRKISKQ